MRYSLPVNKQQKNCRKYLPLSEELESRTLLSAALAAPAVAAVLPKVAIVASRPAASEINGATTGRGIFTLVRSGRPTDSLTVNYTITGTATNGIDFVPLSGTVTFDAGKSTAKIVVTPLTDVLAEGKETVILGINASADYTVRPHKGSAKVTIRDAAPTVRIVSVRNGIEANPVNPRDGLFRVIRTGALDQPLTVNYIAAGTAVSGTDFTALPGSVIIPAGQRTAIIHVTPIADNVTDLHRTVVLTLKSSADFNLSPIIRQQSATIRITDMNPLRIGGGFSPFFGPSLFVPAPIGTVAPPVIGAAPGLALTATPLFNSTSSLAPIGISPSLGTSDLITSGLGMGSLATSPFTSSLSEPSLIQPIASGIGITSGSFAAGDTIIPGSLTVLP